MSTAHANSPRDLLSRLETMALMSDVDLPVSHVREQIASALDLVVHTGRLADGRRVVTAVASVDGLRGGAIQTRDLFSWHRRQAGTTAPLIADPEGGRSMAVSVRSSLASGQAGSAGLAQARWPGSLRRLGGVLE